MSELRKLTWKYFWEQKIKEVGIALLIIIGIIFIPYLVGICFPESYIRFILDLESKNLITYWMYWGAGFLNLVIPIVFIGVFYNLISNWVGSNWKKATERAKCKLAKDTLNGELDLK